MKKKLLIIILTITAAICCALGFFACDKGGNNESNNGGGNETERHKHSYAQTVTPPTCTKQGYTTYTCSCGDRYTGNYTDSVSHYYVDGICKWCNKARPESYIIDGLNYFLSDDGTYFICGGSGAETEGDIVIASECNGKPVKAINESAFEYCILITSVTIPNSVEFIGKYAFRHCESLITATIPDSVTKIGFYAFTYCKGLTVYCENESKPDGWDVEWNGGRDVYRCPVIWDCANNKVADNGCIYDEVDGIRYSLKNGNAVVTMQFKDIEGEITIPQSVNYGEVTYKVISIVDNAFDRCYSLTGISIPYGVTSIGDSAFESCGKLASATIPDTVTSIGKYAFAYCGSLKDLNIPKGLTSISEGAFRQCLEFKNVTIHDGVKTIDKMAFYSCSRLISVTIPDSVTSIGVEAFYPCWNLENIIYNGTRAQWDGITKKQGNDSLRNCTIICSDGYIYKDGTQHGHAFTQSIIEPECTNKGYTLITCDCGYSRSENYVDPLGHNYVDGVCARCLTSFSTEGLEYTLSKDGTFYTCSRLGTARDSDIIIASQYMGKPVKAIGVRAFYNYDGLRSVYIPDSITTIGRAFERCGNLTTITIPDSVTTIGAGAFKECSSLESIEIPYGVTAIATGTFYGCSSLTDITIPDSVVSIDSLAFFKCTSLKNIVIPESVNSIGHNAFLGCTGLESIVIPDGVTDIEIYTFKDCSSLTQITIPESVTRIGYMAFEECTSLTDIYFKGTREQWDNIIKGVDWDKNCGNYIVHCTDD